MLRRQSIFSYLVITTLSFLLLVSAYFYPKYLNIKKDSIENAGLQSLQQLAFSERELKNLQRQFISIAELLSHSSALYDYIIFPSESRRIIVEQSWASVAHYQKWYRQIQFIDIEGQERARIDYSYRRKQVVARGALRDESQSPYFKFAQTLTDENIGVWLSSSAKQVDAAPVIRLIEPVNVIGKEEGYLIVSVDVGYLSARLNQSIEDNFHIRLYDQNGLPLIRQQLVYQEGSVTAANVSLSTLSQDLWQLIQSQKSGSLQVNGTIVAFNTITISDTLRLHQVIMLDKQTLLNGAARDYYDLYQQISMVLLMGVVFLLPTSSAFVYYRKRSVESQLARAALSGMSAVMISDKLHRAVLVNDEFVRLTGFTSEQIESQNALQRLLNEEQANDLLAIFDQLSQEQSWEGEISITTADGQDATAIMRVQSVCSSRGKVSYYITSLVDISDRKVLEEQLRMLSEKDELTQLWNRRKFEAELSCHTKRIERYPDSEPVCLGLIDIDHFKRINDQKGHDEGDRVIRLVADILKITLRETDFLARIGGEEFAVIMPNTSLVEADAALNRLREAVEQEMKLPITISIGYTTLSSDRTKSYKCADIALYDSKSMGRNQVQFCSTDESVL